jgi:hypothetical protein
MVSERYFQVQLFAQSSLVKQSMIRNRVLPNVSLKLCQFNCSWLYEPRQF